MEKRAAYLVTDPDAGMRLDAFAARELNCGLREAKRRIENGDILVNGKAKPPRFKLPSGASVLSIQRSPNLGQEFASAVKLIAATNEYVAFHKPAGLHSASIAAGRKPSLEDMLCDHWPTWRDAWALEPETALPAEPPELVNRLDAATSGIVVAAFNQKGVRRFRDLEAAGLVDKLYFAVVRGILVSPLDLRGELDVASRKKTRVRETETAEKTRRTKVIPLSGTMRPSFQIPQETTLVRAHIQRGARHQIRAHLAHAGFPILGDALYGQKETVYTLYLHHARIIMPGFSARRTPEWLSEDFFSNADF